AQSLKLQGLGIFQWFTRFYIVGICRYKTKKYHQKMAGFSTNSRVVETIMSIFFYCHNHLHRHPFS
ncbi:MAG: hypothetical protein SPH80_05215, partial [Peptoniphilaceae bacterium]|nr:hypothetical protein [Peptoniphilaceae bacterium]